MVGLPEHRLYVYDKVLGQIVKRTSWYVDYYGDGAPRYINFSVSDGELVVLLKTGEYNAKILRTGLPLSDKMSEDIIVTKPPFYTENATFTVY